MGLILFYFMSGYVITEFEGGCHYAIICIVVFTSNELDTTQIESEVNEVNNFTKRCVYFDMHN